MPRMRLVVIVLGLAACNPFRNGELKGRVEGTGDVGTWVLEQGTCYSGQREQFHGVMGLGPEGTGIGVKLVKDGVRGWTAVINRADDCKAAVEKTGCRGVVFSPESCTTLEVDIEPTNTTINNIKSVEGGLRIDCKTATASIKGQLTFERCH